VLLGNPPWEKAKVEEQRWWGLRFPGMYNMPAAERQLRMPQLMAEHPDLTKMYQAEVAAAADLRKILTSGPYPGIGKGDPDLYQAFAWRNWNLLRATGLAGVVMPRGALSGVALQEWRERILTDGAFRDVVFLINTKHWVFAMEARYAFAFLVVSKADQGIVRFSGPFHSELELNAGRDQPAEVSANTFLSWTENAAFPTLPSAKAVEIFSKLREHPRFDSPNGLELRPRRELDPTLDREIFQPPKSGEDAMNVWGGANLGIWGPNESQLFAVGSRKRIENEFLRRMEAGIKKGTGAYAGLKITNETSLPWRRARVSFRRISNSTNRRTAIVCLVPPGVALSNGAEDLVAGPNATPKHEAYALGVLSSIPYDWQVRKVVDLNFTFDILRATTLPVVPLASPLALRLINRAGSLAAIDERYAPWAAAVGVSVGGLVEDNDERHDAIAEIDALVAHLYGLNPDQLKHIFETFHRGWDASKPDYVDHLNRVMKHYETWATKS